MADTGFSGKLTIDGTDYDVLSFGMDFSRGTDQKGRPNSRVMAGGLNVVVEITEQTNLLTLMINSANGPIKEGTLKFIDAGDNEKVMRQVAFENAFVEAYSEGFNPSGSQNFICNVSLTAEKIKIGTGTVAEYDAGWPVSS